MSGPAEQSFPPSDWVLRWMPLIRGGGRVLDVACGHGRHSAVLARAGFRGEAVDVNPEALAETSRIPGIKVRQADLEQDLWPYAPASFDGIVVANYLHRPLFPRLIATLTADGVLIYETFAAGNERFGRPSNPDFLLQPGELLRGFAGLRVIAYEDVRVERPAPAMVQRICACKGSGQLQWER